MRRIYESGALRRNDDAFFPNERNTSDELQAMRSVNATELSRWLIPDRLRYRAISIEVSTPRTEYPVGTTVPFRVTMRNALPFPITIRTVSPLLWTWSVDGTTGASHVSLRDSPDEAGTFHFDRGERKRFTKRWKQMFRVSETKWEPATRGKYVIGAEFNVENSVKKGLCTETTVCLVPEHK